MAVCLKIIQGMGQGQTLSIPNDQPITLGRSSQASYAFDDPLLSRKHCAIECRGALVRVADLQSRNGTFVNGQRLTAPLVVKPGDRIKIGSILMEIAPSNVPAAAPAPVGGTVLLPPPGSGAPLQPGMPVGGMPYPQPQPVEAPVQTMQAAQLAAARMPPGQVDFGATLAAPHGYAHAPGLTPPPPGMSLPQGMPGAYPGMAPPPQAAVCEACRRPLQPHEVRPFRGRIVCPKCLDRYDVEEDMIEGFKIIERLGSTGNGTVYKAKQLLMGRLVTLKTIVTGAETDQKSLRRFMREAKAGGRLSHPSIIELYDVNEQGDLMYIVMEFVDGETLEQMIKARGPVPVPEAVRYMGHIADALKYAHEQQIIHRDIRPATILVRREDGRAKLTDFTLAKNLERAAFSVITTDGEAIGTPYYMPPEQVKSAKAADYRSDIYSFAATFYHAISGKFPIEARSYGEFIAKVFSQEAPPITTVAPQVPPKLSALLQKAMAKDPGHRYPAMPDLMNDLGPIAKSVGATA